MVPQSETRHPLKGFMVVVYPKLSTRVGVRLRGGGSQTSGKEELTPRTVDVCEGPSFPRSGLPFLENIFLLGKCSTFKCERWVVPVDLSVRHTLSVRGGKSWR